MNHFQGTVQWHLIHSSMQPPPRISSRHLHLPKRKPHSPNAPPCSPLVTTSLLPVPKDLPVWKIPTNSHTLCTKTNSEQTKDLNGREKLHNILRYLRYLWVPKVLCQDNFSSVSSHINRQLWSCLPIYLLPSEGREPLLTQDLQHLDSLPPP